MFAKKVPVLAMCSSASATHLRRATGSTNARANPPAWAAALEDNHESLSHAVLPASTCGRQRRPHKRALRAVPLNGQADPRCADDLAPRTVNNIDMANQVYKATQDKPLP